jgi:hypothetical protein
MNPCPQSSSIETWYHTTFFIIYSVSNADHDFAIYPSAIIPKERDTVEQ